MRTSDVLIGVGFALAAAVAGGNASAQDAVGGAAPVAAVAEAAPADSAASAIDRYFLPPGETGTAGAVAFAADSTGSAEDAMASFLDGAGGGVSSTELLNALEGAAEAGQPDALWRLGVMYENGDGVKKDDAKAFGYFSRIANDYASTSPKSLEAEVVAQSFVKIGEYYREGLPDAGIAVDPQRSNALIMHAASYFGDADAQYRIGTLFLDPKGLGVNPLQSARWLSLAARKGHVGAQAKLGDLLFNGEEGITAQPVEGLMWLEIADNHASGTPDEVWVGELLNRAMSVATPDERQKALTLADTIGSKFGG